MGASGGQRGGEASGLRGGRVRSHSFLPCGPQRTAGQGVIGSGVTSGWCLLDLPVTPIPPPLLCLRPACHCACETVLPEVIYLGECVPAMASSSLGQVATPARNKPRGDGVRRLCQSWCAVL